MSDGEYVGLELDFWDDSVGAFEPGKVLRQLRKAFPEAVIDPTDTQRARLLQLLNLWAKNETVVGQYDTLIRQAWWQYQTCGPSYRFVVPFPIGHVVNGSASRLSINFWLPIGLPSEYRERLLTFLGNLRMGQPKIETLDEVESPDVGPDSPSVRVPEM